MFLDRWRRGREGERRMESETLKEDGNESGNKGAFQSLEIARRRYVADGKVSERMMISLAREDKKGEED